MNERRPFLPIAALAAALLALAGCDSPAAEPVPLAGARMGGSFALTDHRGHPFNSDSLRGKYRIVYFGYTYCPDVCPVDLQILSAALSQYEQRQASRATRIQPLFITTDPQRDTPRVMWGYVRNFHPRLIGLTGSPEEIARVERAYGVYASRREPAQPGGDYLVDHNRVATLYGPQGEPITMLHTDEGPAAVLADLEHWVR
jgi:protein SCO1/2